jgi:hypothetical protein
VPISQFTSNAAGIASTTINSMKKLSDYGISSRFYLKKDKSI